MHDKEFKASREKSCDTDVKQDEHTAETKLKASEDNTKLKNEAKLKMSGGSTQMEGEAKLEGGMKLQVSEDDTKLVDNAKVEDMKLVDNTKLEEDMKLVGDMKLKMSEGDTKLEDNTDLKSSSFTPELETETTQVSYRSFVVIEPIASHRFRCPGPGQFQCTSTGLVFVMTQEVELLYRTVQWDEAILQSAGKMAAGPLFSIQCPEDAVCRLHLPHCETMEALLSEGLLSVIHISDDGMSIIEPLEITDTHVIVTVPHLSSFGLVWAQELLLRIWNNMRSVVGQVLLFRPPNQTARKQSLHVFLLPNNVPLEEVRMQELLQPNSQSKLISKDDFYLNFGPNYHPTFEIILTSSTEEVTVVVKDQTETPVWECEVHLPGPSPARTRSISSDPSFSAEERLRCARTEFIERVSETVLHELLDELLDCGVVTDHEMESIAVLRNRAEKARSLMDTVRKKGPTSSTALITALCEVDPFLSAQLNLK
ncbi:hypothetical protein INR49_021962 [Caranx melampygus]|nr:hypothetical protein INR49_021962 [Caranx melampygus]